jgi:hypothetical protein
MSDACFVFDQVDTNHRGHVRAALYYHLWLLGHRAGRRQYHPGLRPMSDIGSPND